MREIDTSTKVCAVIGNPVEHSLSPAIHNAAFEALDLNYIYVAFKVEDVGGAAAGIKAFGNFRGLSVTIPHKVSIMQYLDEIDEVTRQIGSVNTVVNNNGRLCGTSSDGLGAVRALERSGVDVSGKRVIVLGSGGAARAITFTLASTRKAPSLTILGVVPEELKKLVSDLRQKTKANVSGESLNEDSLAKGIWNADIVIHCSPVGMHPKIEETLVPKHLFRAGLVVFDIVYNPYKTRLLKEAEAAGCAIIAGLEMFVNQAVVQFELWTGETAPVDVMRRVVEKHLFS